MAADSGQRQLPLLQKRAVNGLRRVINKGISEEHLKNAATLSISLAFQHLRVML